MENTLTIQPKEAEAIIVEYLKSKGYAVKGRVNFVCTDNYPSAKDYEGNWITAVKVNVEAQPVASLTPSWAEGTGK